DYAEAFYTLGTAYYLGNRTQEAIEPYKRAIALKKTYDRAYRVLGNVYMSLKMDDERIAIYADWVRNVPGKAEPHLWLGSAYYGDSRYPEAIASFKEAIRLKPN